MRMDGGAVSDLHASSADKKAYEAYRALFADREKACDPVAIDVSVLQQALLANGIPTL